jgi:hypothetical protein
MQRLKMVVGLQNEEGKTELRTIDSPLLLNMLTRFLAVSDIGEDLDEKLVDDEVVFNAMTMTDPKVVDPKDYEIACEQLGLLWGFAEQAITSQITKNKELN